MSVNAFRLDMSYLRSLHRACKVLPVSFGCSHKTLTVLYPDVIDTSWLDLVHSHEITIRHQHPPVYPVPRVVLPCAIKIYTRLRACRTKQSHFRGIGMTIEMPKSEPFPLLEVSPLTTNSHQFSITILRWFNTPIMQRIETGSPGLAAEMPCSSFCVVSGNSGDLMFGIQGSLRDSRLGEKM